MQVPLPKPPPQLDPELRDWAADVRKRAEELDERWAAHNEFRDRKRRQAEQDPKTVDREEIEAAYKEMKELERRSIEVLEELADILREDYLRREKLASPPQPGPAIPRRGPTNRAGSSSSTRSRTHRWWRSRPLRRVRRPRRASGSGCGSRRSWPTAPGSSPTGFGHGVGARAALPGRRPGPGSRVLGPGRG